jgi:hypothetical protein
MVTVYPINRNFTFKLIHKLIIILYSNMTAIKQFKQYRVNNKIHNLIIFWNISWEETVILRTQNTIVYTQDALVQCSNLSMSAEEKYFNKSSRFSAITHILLLCRLSDQTLSARRRYHIKRYIFRLPQK